MPLPGRHLRGSPLRACLLVLALCSQSSCASTAPSERARRRRAPVRDRPSDRGAQGLVWRAVHALITNVVVALSPLTTNVYVLLWIVDWLPHVQRVHSEFRKVQLIENVLGSIRARRERR